MNPDGVCNNCRRDQVKSKASNFEHIKQMVRQFKIAKAKKAKYDAIVQLSGGKDSIFLLKELKEKYKLNLLAFSVIHPLVTKTALDNIRQATKKLSIHSVKYKVDELMYKKYVGNGLSRWREFGTGTSYGVNLCNYFTFVITYNYAIKNKIPMVISGIDANQSRPCIVDNEHKANFLYYTWKWYGQIFERIFGQKYKGTIYDQNFEKFPVEDLPTTVWPLTIIDYNPDLERKKLDQKKIIKAQNLSPLLTGWPAYAMLDYLSFRHYQAPSMIDAAANAIRNGKMVVNGRKVNRDEYLEYLSDYGKMLGYFVKNKKISKDKFNDFPKIFPGFYNIFGRQVADFMIKNRICLISHFIKYFRINLH